MWHTSFYVILVFTQFTISCGNENISKNYLSVLDFNVNSLLRNVGRSDLSYLSRDNDENLCVDHILQIIRDVPIRKRYALEVIDAWGKIPSGIYSGNLAEMGHFDQCLSVTFPNETVRGKYCLAIMEIEGLLPPNARLGQINPEKPQLSIGICVPDSCKTDFLNIVINDTLVELFNFSLKQDLLQESFCSQNTEIQFSVIDWFAITIFSVVGFLMLFSTIYELMMNYFEKPGKPILIMFSIYTNAGKLFAMQKAGGTTDVMHCLNGIRCLSIVWVVFGHSYMFLMYTPLINSIELLKWVQTYYSMVLINAPIVVDTFFIMSGLLVSWSVLRQLNKTGKLNIPLMYFHRFLRLTPILGATILFSVSLIKYVVSGPLWNTASGTIVDQCEDYWWSAILFVQNYVNPNRMCLGHTWYLSVDTQLYVLSPLILIPMWKWKRKVILIIPILILISISYTFAIFMIKDFSMNMAPNQEEQMEMTYYPTHTRMGPWLVGILLGYYLNLNRGRHIKLSKFVVMLGWICCCTIILAIIFGPYQVMQLTSKASTIESAFYCALSRTSWSIAVGWIILACTQGYGGIVNTFLSCPLWQPFGRLTYSIYIVHLILQTVILGHMRTNVNFTDFEVITKFWGDFGITLSISILMVLAFESPIIALEKILFKQTKQKPTTSSTQILCINEASSSGNIVEKSNV